MTNTRSARKLSPTMEEALTYLGAGSYRAHLEPAKATLVALENRGMIEWASPLETGTTYDNTRLWNVTVAGWALLAEWGIVRPADEGRTDWSDAIDLAYQYEEDNRVAAADQASMYELDDAEEADGPMAGQYDDYDYAADETRLSAPAAPVMADWERELLDHPEDVAKSSLAEALELANEWANANGSDWGIDPADLAALVQPAEDGRLTEAEALDAVYPGLADTTVIDTAGRDATAHQMGRILDADQSTTDAAEWDQAQETGRRVAELDTEAEKATLPVREPGASNPPCVTCKGLGVVLAGGVESACWECWPADAPVPYTVREEESGSGAGAGPDDETVVFDRTAWRAAAKEVTQSLHQSLSEVGRNLRDFHRVLSDTRETDLVRSDHDVPMVFAGVRVPTDLVTEWDGLAAISWARGVLAGQREVRRTMARTVPVQRSGRMSVKSPPLTTPYPFACSICHAGFKTPSAWSSHVAGHGIESTS